MILNPSPKMKSQIGRAGILGVVDLNCGWYCLEALLNYFYFKRKGCWGQGILPVPKIVSYGYNPKRDSPFETGVVEWSRPGTKLSDWETDLKNRGPLIVSGKLGAAHFGTIKGKALGVGHFILVFGAENGLLWYKDPLQGDQQRNGYFAEMKKRLGGDVYFLNPGKKEAVMNSITGRSRSRAVHGARPQL